MTRSKAEDPYEGNPARRVAVDDPRPIPAFLREYGALVRRTGIYVDRERGLATPIDWPSNEMETPAQHIARLYREEHLLPPFENVAKPEVDLPESNLPTSEVGTRDNARRTAETALRIANQRAGELAKIREALLRDDTREAVRLMRHLCGIEESSNR